MAVLALGVAMPSAGARDAACAAAAAPVVSVTVQEGDVRLDHSLDTAAIGARRAQAAATGQRVPPPQWRTIGLTVAEFQVRTEIRGQFSQPAARSPAGRDGGRTGCAHVTHIDMTIGYAAQTIYVPKTYEPGSCAYRAVLAHERLHVADNIDVLREFADRFRAGIQELAADMEPLQGVTQEQARRRPLKALEAGIKPVSEAFQAAQAARAAARDTPDEYRAVARQCQTW